MPRDFRSLMVGLDRTVPLLDGTYRPYINLDNAASTPAFKRVQGAVVEFLAWYSSVHRGAGFKSRVATRAYEDARQVVGRFVGADPEDHVVIFGKNTTEALNKVAARFPFAVEGRNVVLTSVMEHHSNDLPFRRAARVIHAGVDACGRLDEADFDDKLRTYGERIGLVAISGASNVTGYVNPVHRLAEKAHAVGAQVLVDCAQLAPHRTIDVGPLADPSHLDYVAFSAHKMYAPFGTGALVARGDVFEEGCPDMSGGGTVKVVTTESVTWADAPDRDEAGSPNVVGAVALAAAIEELDRIGMEAIADHEMRLTAYALGRLRRIKGLRLFGESDPARTGERLGVISFELEDVPHFLVAAVLSAEYGIGVRSGCFCAHPYVLRLLQVPEGEVRRIRAELVADDRRGMPGLVRASFGLYNDNQEVDVLAEGLERIARREWKGKYVQDRSSGEFEAVGWEPDLPEFFDVPRREATAAVAAL
jgi:selenocysteine lyase/cysteine desulfurase